MPIIKQIKCIRSRHRGTWLIVKVITDQPGLYGIGSASDHWHAETVLKAVERLSVSLIGRDVSNIEDNWQLVHTSCYWRNGSILNTALGGIDMALWDIKGKEAGMPVFRLLGGPCRSAVPVYGHAGGKDFEDLEDRVRQFIESGYQVVRCQVGPYGGGGFIEPKQARLPENAWTDRAVFDDEAYLDTIPKMFEHLRTNIGFGVKLTHDVHEHLKPQNAVILAKLLEPFRLFFVEDILPPEHIQWFRKIREQCTTPQAMGELFVNPNEWMPLVTERLIDFARVRVSKGAGITQCRKIAVLCEWFGIQTAWQEGADNDPVNQMAACHLDMASSSFGIQEENHFADAELDAFPGHAEIRGGYMYPNETPGLGIDIDEEKAVALMDSNAAGQPPRHEPDRRADGSIVRP
ncbi:MAG: mandelate racemase [Planctomycetota bacterium]|nr:mandelate racemase [Planctomycetota bacterium]